MKQIFRISLVLALFFLAQGSRADNNQATNSTSRVMTLDDCMSYAIANSNRTHQQATLTKNAALDFTGSWLKHLPSLSGNINANSNFGRGIDPATNSYVNTTTFSNGVGVGGSIPIFYGMRYLNQTRSAKVAKLKGEKQLERTKDEVAELTMAAYAEVVYSDELLGLCMQRVESYKIQERKMSRMVELGSGSEADLAQIRATLASEEYNAIAARNALELSVVKLKDCMNFPLEDSLKIEPKIGEASLFEPEQSTDELVEFAAENNLKAVMGQQTFDINKFDLKIAKGSYYPSVYASGGISSSYYTRLDGASGSNFDPWAVQLKNNIGEYAGVSMSIPIFSGLSTRLNVHKAKNNFEQAKRDLDQTLRELQSEIRRAVLELESSEKQWYQGVRNVEYQRIANDAARRKYEQGLLSIIELQTSDSQLFAAEIELRNAYLRYQLKVREVNYYKGVPYVN